MGLAFAIVIVAVTAAGAADVVVSGAKIRLERSGGAGRLMLELRDPAIPAPPPGGADDPATAGLRVLLFGHDTPGEVAELVAPGGLGRPGWSRGSRGGVRHRFRNRGAPGGPSPIRSVVLRDGRGLRIMARDAGLGLTGPQGSVGVRIEIGSLRLCTLFAGDAVVRDAAGRFAAKNAPAPGLVACTDEGLAAVPCDASATCGGTCPDGSQCGGLPARGVPCSCIAASQPCGDTEPVCNGTCPAGESCVNVGGVPYPDCACLPTGSTGCGTVYPTCGDGDCPAGTTCSVTTFTCCGGVSISGCACLSPGEPPGPPCGGPCPPGSTCVPAGPGVPEGCYPIDCSGGRPCPPGSTCVSPPGLSIEVCAPMSCAGGAGHPTCDGTCDPGLSCQSISGACYCAP